MLGDKEEVPKEVEAQTEDTTEEQHDHHGEESLKWYETPYARYEWGEPQTRRHVDWADLFFDVIYVAVCFQAGNLLLYVDSEGVYQVTMKSFWSFVAVFWALFYGWDSRMFYLAKFKSEDLFHSSLQVVQGLLIAMAAHSVTKDISKFEENSLALIFTSCLLLHTLIDFGVALELYFFSKHEATSRMQVLMGSCMLLRLVMLLCSVVTIVSNSFVGTLVLWGGSYFVPSALRFWIVLCQCLNRKAAVPVDVGYVMQRYGEWTMLVLGEAVFQIVLADADYDNPWYYTQISLSYLLMAFFQLLHYSVQFSEDEHAMRQSRARALIWHQTQLFYSTALVILGVAIKLGLKEKEEDFRMVLSFSAGFSAACILVQQLLHLGVGEELGIHFCVSKTKLVRFTRGAERKRIWFSKFVLTLLIMLAPLFGVDEENRPLYLIIVNIFLLLIIVFQVVSGAFKRDKKLKTTLTTLKAVGKFKRNLAVAKERQESGETEAEAENVEVKDVLEKEVQLDKSSSKKSLRSLRKKTARKMHAVKKGTSKNVRRAKKTVGRVREMNIYTAPTASVDWDALEKEHQTDWADLFFDLIYVALAFKLGYVFTNSLTVDYQIHIEVWYFVSLYIATFECWANKVYYNSSVTTEDFVHKVVDVIEGLLVTILACSIPKDLGRADSRSVEGSEGRLLAPEVSSISSKINEREFAYVFGVTKLLCVLLACAKFLECYFTGDKPGLVSYGKAGSLKQLLGAIPVALSLIPASLLEGDDERSNLLAVVTLLWTLSFVIAHGITWFGFCFRLYNNSNTIPIHLEVFLHRYGEWTILMFGVGTLRVILQENRRDEVEHWIVFGLAFMVSSVYRKLHFYVERFSPFDHAARYSRMRGLLWGEIATGISISVLAMGYGLGVITTKYERLSSGLNVDYFWTFSGATACYLGLLWMIDIDHVGSDECVFVSSNSKLKRFAVYAGKIVTTFILLVFPPTDVPAWFILGFALIVAFFSFFLSVQHSNQRISEHELHDEQLLNEASAPKMVRQSSLSKLVGGAEDPNCVKDEDGEGGVLVHLD